jgi:uncharacterized surface protein with fasciclin (FAS1) repeats
MKNIVGMKNYIKFLCVIAVIVSVVVGCKDELKEKLYKTATGVTMAEYIKMAPDTFSELYKILEKTNSLSFLNAYGSYTLFAPTNEAIHEFVQNQGKTSIDDFTSDEDINLLKEVVRLHLCPDTISSSNFREGGLSDTTMSGVTLTIDFGVGGINDITISKTAKIIKRDILVINGVIHAINKVLVPVDFSYQIFDKIAANPAMSIFAEALRQTGLNDSLKSSTYLDNYGIARPYGYTVFAIPDSVYGKYNIKSYTDLKNRFSNTGNPKLNPADTLYILMATLCIRDKSSYFLRDFNSGNYLTLSKEYITVSLKDTFTLNKYFVVNKEQSNNAARNGVYHLMDSMLVFKPVPPEPLYLDIFSNWPEFTSRTDLYLKVAVTFPGLEFPNGLPYVRVGNGTYKYGYGDQYCNKDRIEMTDFPANEWFEIDLPSVNMGTYNVWVCAKVAASRADANVLIDGVMLGKIIMKANASAAGINLDSKLYMKSNNSQYVGILAGTVTFPKTGTHVIRFQHIPGETLKPLTIDMIHLIPVGTDQKTVQF